MHLCCALLPTAQAPWPLSAPRCWACTALRCCATTSWARRRCSTCCCAPTWQTICTTRCASRYAESQDMQSGLSTCWSAQPAATPPCAVGCCFAVPCLAGTHRAPQPPKPIPPPALVQAERLRAKAQRPEASRSMQQQCRYLYYLGRIRAVQVLASGRQCCGPLVCCSRSYAKKVASQGHQEQSSVLCIATHCELSQPAHPTINPRSWSIRRPRTACSRRHARWAAAERPGKGLANMWQQLDRQQGQFRCPQGQCSCSIDHHMPACPSRAGSHIGGWLPRGGAEVAGAGAPMTRTPSCFGCCLPAATQTLARIACATCMPRTLPHSSDSPPFLALPQVRLLLGEVPDRTEFTAPDWAQQLVPYFDITQASGVAVPCALLGAAWSLGLCACKSLGCCNPSNPAGSQLVSPPSAPQAVRSGDLSAFARVAAEHDAQVRLGLLAGSLPCLT